MNPSGPFLNNQSRVTFSSGGISQVAYSNTVITPRIGPVIQLVKSASKSRAARDETFAYRISLENKGNREAQVTLYDALPPGTAFIANSLLRDGTPLPGVHPDSGIELGALGAGASVNIEFQVILVSLPPDLRLVNRARADYVFFTDGGRTITGSAYSNFAEVQVTGHLLSAYLHASTGQTFIGDIVTYTISIANEGNAAVQQAVVTFHVLAGEKFVQGSVEAGDVLMPSADPESGIPAGSIAAGASQRVSFRVLITGVPESGRFTNEAYVRYRAGEPRETAVTNPVTVTVIEPAVTLRKSVNRARAVPGDRLIYELIAENNGPLAVDAVLIDPMPEGALFIWDSVRADGSPLRGMQPAQGIDLGTLRAGSRSVITFQAGIRSAAGETSLPPLVNRAQLNYTFRLSDGRLVQQSARSDSAVTTLYSPLLQLQADAIPALVEPGDLVHFELHVTNGGNWAFSTVALTQLVPGETSIVDGSIRVDGESAGDRYAGGFLRIGEVGPGTTIRIVYEARVSEDAEVSVIKGYAAAVGRFALDGREYRLEARSNPYTLLLEEQSE
ncbi:hypothetical protein [Paenibacillus humicola]|uniref:hypothetical protein n=1 Tax=Paenibacillus humicola TaxID=3110540 RepID=UPI00237BE1F5|nr:hypothetical protein [Paenibacillus humicola]